MRDAAHSPRVKQVVVRKCNVRTAGLDTARTLPADHTATACQAAVREDKTHIIKDSTMEATGDTQFYGCC